MFDHDQCRSRRAKTCGRAQTRRKKLHRISQGACPSVTDDAGEIVPAAAQQIAGRHGSRDRGRRCSRGSARRHIRLSASFVTSPPPPLGALVAHAMIDIEQRIDTAFKGVCGRRRSVLVTPTTAAEDEGDARRRYGPERISPSSRSRIQLKRANPLLPSVIRQRGLHRGLAIYFQLLHAACQIATHLGCANFRQSSWMLQTHGFVAILGANDWRLWLLAKPDCRSRSSCDWRVWANIGPPPMIQID